MSNRKDFDHYINTQIAGIPNLLTEYRAQTKKWYFELADKGSAAFDLPSLFSMDKQLKVGGSTSKTVGRNDDNVKSTVTCPLSGELQIESVYQSIYHVPIGLIKVQVEATDGSDSREVTLDAKGMATVTELTPGKQYSVVINHKPTESELNALFSHYDALGNELVTWLNGKWVGFSDQWDKQFTQSNVQSVLNTLGKLFSGIWDGLTEFWKGIGELYDLLKDPVKALDGMMEHGKEILGALTNAAKNAPQSFEKLMLFASDEAAMYLFTNAIMVYLSMVPMTLVWENLAHMGGEAVAGVLLGILGGVIVSFVATPALGAAYAIFSAVKRVGKSILKVMEPLVEVIADLLKYAKSLINRASDTYRRIAINAGGKQKYRNGKVEIEAKNKLNSKLETHDTTPDKSTVPKTESGDATQSEKLTACDADPISMATGEELLSVIDGELIGLLPFEWKRLYRTSAVEHNLGLGFGWSYPLAHTVVKSGDEIVWKDSESKLTRFPVPTRQVPVITNIMAESAAFLDRDDHIVILSGDKHYVFELEGDQGRLIRIRDKYHHELTITYDKHHRPSQVVSGTNVKFVVQYNESSLIEQLDVFACQPNSTEWERVQTQARYTYNEAQQLVAVSNANGEIERYTYNEQNVIQSRELAGGAIFYWEWQGEGKAVRAIRQYSNISTIDTRYEWDDAANTVTLITSNGMQQVYQHDKNARLIREVDASGGEYCKAYDEKGRLIAEVDALGNKTEFVYNQHGDMTAKTEPNGLVTEFRYHKSRLIEVTQEKASWRYEHDDVGHIIQQTNPLGHTTRYRYNDHGLIERITYADGSLHTLTWNMNGQLIEEATPQGEAIRYRYDVLGRLRYRQDSLGVSEMHYDAVGRLTKHVLPGGLVRQYQYNAYSKVTSQTDEQGRTTHFEYAFPSHQVTQRVNPDGSRLQYAYNNRFNFLSDIVNERGETYHIEYAPTGHVSREVTFDGREFRYEYDAHTQLVAKTEVGSEGTELTTRYAYNVQGRLTHKILPDEQAIEYHYDRFGRLTEVDDGHWPLAYCYNLLGQLEEEHQGWASQGYRYDAMGQLNAMLLPDGQVVDYLLSKGQLQQVNLNGQRLTTHDYQVNGLETQRQQGALTSHYQYDGLGRLLEHPTRQSSPPPLIPTNLASAL